MKFILLYCLLFGSLVQNLVAHELAIVSMFRNTAPYLKEWVEYHHMIGVDHFWLYNDASTDNWEEVLRPYIKKGIVEVFYWPAGKPDWVPRQMEAFRDGIRRGVGTTKWVALIDQDEFILPMQDRSITECLKKHFSKAPAVYVNWRNFGTNGICVPRGLPLLSRLTACSIKRHSRNHVGKSIVRPEYVDIHRIWYPHHFPLLKGAKYFDGDGNKTLIADGMDWKPDRKHHDRYIRINHYAFRDEKYFREIRLPRDSHPQLILKQHHAYNRRQDRTILSFIKKRYPNQYKKLWKK